MIPYASITDDIILHPDCPLPKKGAKDVINLLKARELSCIIEVVVQISPERYRVTFDHARQWHAFPIQDFFIHGKPVEFKSVSRSSGFISPDCVMASLMKPLPQLWHHTV